MNFTKKNEFVIYIGSHGDKGAEYADIILPSAAYTEQDGHFTNLEGKLQKAYKASYPPGDAKEDWEILNELSTTRFQELIAILKLAETQHYFLGFGFGGGVVEKISLV